MVAQSPKKTSSPQASPRGKPAKQAAQKPLMTEAGAAGAASPGGKGEHEPATHESPKTQAPHGIVAGKHHGVLGFQDYIQQGPIGITLFCLVGGIGTSLLGAMNVCNVFGNLHDLFHYILNVYMFIFGMITSVTEADPRYIVMLVPPLDQLAGPVMRTQAWMNKDCRLFTLLHGRGAFYLFQGSLLMTQCVRCLVFLNGAYSLVMGALCLMASYGAMSPDSGGAAASAGTGLKQYHRLDTEACGEDGQVTHVDADTLARARAAWKGKKDTLQGKVNCELWAMHRQATAGDCAEPKPSGIFNGNAKEQWRLWSGLKGTSREEAKVMFVERVRKESIMT